MPRSSAREPVMPGVTEGPRIGVVLCTCNGESYLREQLDSILGQSRPVHEIVIADDASTDGTRELLGQYQLRFPDLVRLHFHPAGLGAVKNFEFALQRCGADLIFLSDQDDVWHPRKVERMLPRFSEPKLLLLFTDGRLIDSAGTALGSTLWAKWDFDRWRQLRWKWAPRSALRDLLHNNNKVTGATVALRRSLLDHALPVRVPHGYWHDAWLALHAAANKGLEFTAEPLISYRIHPKQQVGLTKGGTTGNADEVAWPDFVRAFERQYPQFSGLATRPGLAASIRKRLGGTR